MTSHRPPPLPQPPLYNPSLTSIITIHRQPHDPSQILDWKHCHREIYVFFPLLKLFFHAAAQGCGGLLSGEEGEFSSPGYPEPYRQNGYCIWIITVPSGNKLELSFDAFDLDESSSCSSHYLMVSTRAADLSR